MPLGFGLVSLTGSLPANHSREMLSGSAYSDTARTIQRMQDMVTLGKREFAVRKLVQQFIFNCPAKDYYCYCEAAHNFCRDKIRYVFDPNGVELIENPARILESRVADCDSIVILMAALCEQMGFPCRFVTIKADKERPEDFSHVFLEVKIPGRGWVGSDPTQPQRAFGWEPGSEYERKNWPASKDAPETREGDEMAGLGFFGNDGMGAIIRGVQTTPGVIVEKPWQWRNEEALITTNPEQMELATFGEGHAPMYTGPRPNFMYASEAEELFFKDQEDAAAPPPPVQGGGAEVVPNLSGMGQMKASEIPTWMLLAGAAGLLFLILRKKK